MGPLIIVDTAGDTVEVDEIILSAPTVILRVTQTSGEQGVCLTLTDAARLRDWLTAFIEGA
jgi:hypothetical protein